MAIKTPATKAANAAQKVLKSIQPREEIALNIIKKVSGMELETVLQGVEAFTKSFSQDDEYMVEIRIDKIFPPDTAEETG
jgi:hypothetical protein